VRILNIRAIRVPKVVKWYDLGAERKEHVMAKKSKQPAMTKRQQRKLRTQQIIFGVIALIVILAMILPSIAQ
jgi:hypothetical protein